MLRLHISSLKNPGEENTLSGGTSLANPDFQLSKAPEIFHSSNMQISAPSIGGNDHGEDAAVNDAIQFSSKPVCRTHIAYGRLDCNSHFN